MVQIKFKNNKMNEREIYVVPIVCQERNLIPRHSSKVCLLPPDKQKPTRENFNTTHWQDYKLVGWPLLNVKYKFIAKIIYKITKSRNNHVSRRGRREGWKRGV